MSLASHSTFSLLDKLSNLPLLIIAAGRGLRLTNGRGSKPLFEFRGKPLIQYALDSARYAGIKRAIVAVRPEDVPLQGFLDQQSSPELLIEWLPTEDTQTHGAARGLIERIGGQTHVFCACDVIFQAPDILRLVRSFHEAQNTHESLLAVIATTEIIGEDSPVWVDVNWDDNSCVTAFGKDLAPTSQTWASVRVCSSLYANAINEYVGWSRDTHVFSDIVERFPGKVVANPMNHLFDIDTPADALATY